MAGTQVDTSMYDKLQGPNMVDVMGKLAGIRSMNNQNMQFEQEYQSRIAMGEIMQKSTDPKTGQPDFAKAALLMAQNPVVAWQAPEFMSKAAALQGAQLDNQMKKFDVVAKRNKMYASYTAPLLDLGPMAKREDVVKATSNMVTAMNEAGIHDKESYDGIIDFLANVPENGMDIHTMLTQVSKRAQEVSTTMDQLKGSFQTINLGDKVAMGSFNPYTKSFTPMGFLPLNPTLEQQNALIESQDPQGQTIKTPRVMAAPMVGGNGQVINAGGGQEIVPQGQVTAPRAPLVSNIGKYHEEQLKTIAAYQKDLNQDVETVNANMQNIQMMRDAAHHVQTGKFANARTDLAQMLKAIGVKDTIYDAVGNGNLADSQVIMKNAAPAAMDSLREHLGSQSRVTNMEFGAFQRSNPNLEMDPKAYEKILDFTQHLMHLKQMEQKAFQVWQDHGQDPTKFPAAWTAQLIKKGFIRGDDAYKPYNPKGP